MKSLVGLVSYPSWLPFLEECIRPPENRPKWVKISTRAEVDQLFYILGTGAKSSGTSKANKCLLEDCRR